MNRSPLLSQRLQEFLTRTRSAVIAQSSSVIPQQRSISANYVKFFSRWLSVLGAIIVLLIVFHRFNNALPVKNDPFLFTLVGSLALVLTAAVFYRIHRYLTSLWLVICASYIAVFALVFFVNAPFTPDVLIYFIVPLLPGFLLLSFRVMSALIVAHTAGLFVLWGIVLHSPPLDMFLRPIAISGVFLSFGLLTKKMLNAAQTRQRRETSESEEIFRRLITGVPIIVFVLDEKGIITLVEGSRLEAIGVAPGGFVGRHVADLYHDYPNILNDWERALAGEIFVSLVELVGMFFDVWYSPLRDSSGNVSGVIGVATDVTERKLAEDLLQYQAGLLQGVSDAIIAVDTDMVIENWNQAAEHLYGWRAHEAEGQKFPAIVVTNEPADWEAELVKQTVDKGFWQGEVCQKRHDGLVMNVVVSASILQDDYGKPTGLVMVCRDITEQKRAEHQAFEFAVQTERIRLLREFINDVSHDFKTPLSIIQTSSYLLKKKHPEISMTHIDAIEAQAQHLGHLLEDLLTLSRLDSTSELDLQRIEVNEFVQQLSNVLQNRAIMRRQQFRTDLKATSAVILSDPAELHRALTHLIVNAINYTPPGGEIIVRTYREKDQVAIAVTDTGIGISSDDLSHVFERFYRVDKARAIHTGGTGLGLSIARKIAEAHNGTITAESVLGSGSTFTLWLPVKDAAA